MRRVQLAFLVFIAVGYTSPPWLYVTLFFSHTIYPNDLHLSPAPDFKTSQVFLIYCPRCPSSSATQCFAPNTLLVSSLNFSPTCWWKQSSCWMLFLPWQYWISYHVQILRHLLPCYINSWNIPHFLVVFYWSCPYWGWLPRVSLIFFSTFIFIPYRLPVPVTPSMLCSIVSSLASSRSCKVKKNIKLSQSTSWRHKEWMEV